MNRILSAALIAASITAAGQAFADDITVETQPFTSTASRAEVQADFFKARTLRDPWSIDYNPLADFKSGLAREQVRAEFIESRDSVAAFTGEDSGSFALAQESDAGVASAENARGE